MEKRNQSYNIEDLVEKIKKKKLTFDYPIQREDSGGEKPQAHKMSKIGYLLDEVRDKHKHIKQCLNYVKVMEDAITYSYTIEKLKLELTKAKHSDYQGRTEYYQMALSLLK